MEDNKLEIQSGLYRLTMKNTPQFAIIEVNDPFNSIAIRLSPEDLEQLANFILSPCEATT
tara:strand:+ start:227 stop:406 length:180 start_codon:yes stop_codon:yes gene_type:complete